ncbi:MAG TPA: PsiF family protein [Candidatus Desulfobacillus sp.]|nr:PsiF family protein [Candidatus Desulfobacillus sp.]
MHKLILAAAASLLAANLALAQAPAAGNKKAPSEKQLQQQERMKACNQEAGDKNLKGDERKKFMSDCLKQRQASQQEKMKLCNQEAGQKSLKGDARKAFMSECLRGDKAAAAPARQ